MGTAKAAFGAPVTQAHADFAPESTTAMEGAGQAVDTQAAALAEYASDFWQ